MLPRPPLALSLAGLDREPETPRSAGPRAAIEWAAGLGYRSVQLDAASSGLRPRDLDRSGRRDLAALLRRCQLALAGLDLWIPPEHFAEPSRADRALGALQAAIDLAADLARLVEGSPPPAVSVVLPPAISPDLAGAIESAGLARGARIADHAIAASTAASARRSAESPIGAGIDPAAFLMGGQDPAAVAARLGASVVSARLSDASLTGRVAPGAGRLDETAYLASLSVAGYARPLVLDLRAVAGQEAAAGSVIARW